MNSLNENSGGLTPQHFEPEDLLLLILETATPEERRAMEEHLGITAEHLGIAAEHLPVTEERSATAERPLAPAIEPSAPGCVQCRQVLDEIREGLGQYALASVASTGLLAPPAEIRGRLLAKVAQPGNLPTHGGLSHERTASIANSPNVANLPGPADESGMAIVAGARPSSGVGQYTTGSRQDDARPASPVRAASSLGASLAAWAGWAVAAALAIAATHFYQQRQAIEESLAAQSGQIARLSADQARARAVVDALTDRSAQRVALSLTKPKAPAQPSGRATYLPAKGTLIFLASHLDPLPTGKTYELWVIPASGAAPVPAGTFRPDPQGNANVVTARLTHAGEAKAFGVTIEALGGSSTPTMPILLAGS